MKEQKTYETFVDKNKLYFRILEGAFRGIEYSYKSLALNGDLQYKIKTKKNLVDNSNKILFEQEIRCILRDKLSKLN